MVYNVSTQREQLPTSPVAHRRGKRPQPTKQLLRCYFCPVTANTEGVTDSQKAKKKRKREKQRRWEGTEHQRRSPRRPWPTLETERRAVHADRQQCDWPSPPTQITCPILFAIFTTPSRSRSKSASGGSDSLGMSSLSHGKNRLVSVLCSLVKLVTRLTQRRQQAEGGTEGPSAWTGLVKQSEAPEWLAQRREKSRVRPLGARPDHRQHGGSEGARAKKKKTGVPCMKGQGERIGKRSREQHNKPGEDNKTIAARGAHTPERGTVCRIQGKRCYGKKKKLFPAIDQSSSYETATRAVCNVQNINRSPKIYRYPSV